MSTQPRRTLVLAALATFLPVAVLATLTAGLVYGVAQQGLRSGANDPQLQMATDAARALDAGADPAAAVGAGHVDVATSLAPFLVVYDAGGDVLASSGVLDGADPVPPAGVLEHAAADAPNVVTWQPRTGVRVATVTARWAGGTVMAGRSLREVERREDQALLLVTAGWLVTLAALAVTSIVAEVVRRP
jgi:hypothetical protein